MIRFFCVRTCNFTIGSITTLLCTGVRTLVRYVSPIQPPNYFRSWNTKCSAVDNEGLTNFHDNTWRRGNDDNWWSFENKKSKNDNASHSKRNTHCILFHHLDLCNRLLHHNEMIWEWLDSLRNSSTRWFRSSFHLSRLSNRRRNRTSKFLGCTFHCHIGIDLVRIRLFKKIFRIINSNFFKETYLALCSESHRTYHYNHIDHHILGSCQYTLHWNR